MDQRISIHLKSPNSVFEACILDMYESAVKTGSRSQHSLKLALDSVRRYPLVLKSAAECAILKGFGKNLCKILEKRLQQTVNTECNKNSHSFQNGAQKRKTEETCAKYNEKKLKVSYVPAYKSGAYAILVTLLKNYQNNIVSLSKTTLQIEAQLICNESMTKPKPGSFYTAWSSMSTLISKGYVNREKKKCMQYSLTDHGKMLALELLNHSYDDIATKLSTCVNKNHSAQIEHNPSTENSISLNYDSLDQIFLEAGSFDVILLVDKQETSGKSKKNDATVLELEKYKMIKYELRHLKVGDFTWIARNRVTNKELVLHYIVERKRMDDLAHSIKDGRFHEQKFRLKQCGVPNVIYLIESYGKNHHNIGLPHSSLKQAIINTRVQDGFMTHFTSSLGNSIKFLAMITKLLNDKYLNLNLCEKQNDQAYFTDTYYSLLEFNKFNSMASKNKILTVKDLFIKQLLQLKGISVEKAVAITSLYPTPRCLMEAFQHTKDKPELLLANIKFGIKMTKIGPTISKTLHRYFTDIKLF